MLSNLSYDAFRLIFIIAAVASGVMVVISAVLFFTLRIPKVIGDLTGTTAKRAIENIRRQNEQSGDKAYKSSAVNMQRGKLTDRISPSGRLIRRDASPFGTGVITEKLVTQGITPEEPANETTVLYPADETSVLEGDYGETTVLQGTAENPVENSAQGFVIEYEITFIHTDEVIT